MSPHGGFLPHCSHSQLKLVNKFGNLNSIKYYSNYQTYLLILIENENNVGELNRSKDSLKECIRRFPVILFIT